MPCYVGLDASKERTSVCVVDESGVIVREGEVASEPKTIIAFLRGEGRRYRRIGLESWTMAPWLYEGLARAGLPIICIETRHTSAVLKAARVNKTDKNDARGIAEIMRARSYKAVHVKTLPSRRIRAFLTVRRMLKLQAVELEQGIGAALLQAGVKLARGGQATYERRVRDLVKKDAFLAAIVEPLLTIRAHLLAELQPLERRVRELAGADPICRRLMTAPGVGPLVALHFRTGIDEPLRFARSRDVGAHLGLTPRTKQSGARDRRGRISLCGDAAVRALLFNAARSQLRADTRESWLKAWARGVAERRGAMKAIVAVARRLAVVLHRMWVTETDFRWSIAAA